MGYKSAYVPLTSTGEKWIEEHINSFVKPHCGGKVPTEPAPNPNKRSNHPPFDPRQPWTPRLMRMLQACWEQAKVRSKGRTILLPGRDTWLFEVMARLEGHKTRFIPECSSSVYESLAKMDDFSGYYCIDSGNRGSVPMGLKVADWDLVYWGPSGTGSTKSFDYAYNPPKEVMHYTRPLPHHQLFMHAIKVMSGGGIGLVYNLYSQLEGHAKYWMSGMVHKGHTIQEIDPAGFHNAALVTLHVARWVLANPLPIVARRVRQSHANKEIYYRYLLGPRWTR